VTQEIVTFDCDCDRFFGPDEVGLNAEENALDNNVQESTKFSDAPNPDGEGESPSTPQNDPSEGENSVVQVANADASSG